MITKHINELIQIKNASFTDRGFTLIELVVVLLVIGVLTAISLPNMIAHVGKARESEAKQNLSAIGFAQQAYHFENGTFSGSYEDMGLSMSSVYYDFAPPTSNDTATISDALPKNLGNDAYRVYSLGTYYDSGAFGVILCQARDPVTPTKAPASSTGSCSNGGVNIQ